jgi:putative membrane protein
MGSFSLMVGQTWPLCHATGASGGWGTMVVWHLLWWGLVAGLVVLWVVVLTRRTAVGGTGSSAAGILDERYARGELTREEYEERRQVLR